MWMNKGLMHRYLIPFSKLDLSYIWWFSILFVWYYRLTIVLHVYLMVGLVMLTFCFCLIIILKNIWKIPGFLTSFVGTNWLMGKISRASNPAHTRLRRGLIYIYVPYEGILTCTFCMKQTTKVLMWATYLTDFFSAVSFRTGM